MTFQFVAVYECKECGAERTKKTRVKVGSFEEECDECGVEAEFGLSVEPMDIDKFGEELVAR